MKYFLSSLLLITLYSCRQYNEKQNPKSKVEVYEINTSNTDTLLTRSDSSKKHFSPEFIIIKNKLDNIVDLFFTEIVLEKIRPEWQINANGYYQVDMNSYILKLDSLAIFDSSFYTNEFSRMKPCIDELEIMKASEKENYNDLWEPSSCFPNFLYWLDAQDEPEYCEITAGAIKNDTVNIEVSYVSLYDEANYWENIHLDIILLKRNNQFLISEVSRIF